MRAIAATPEAALRFHAPKLRRNVMYVPDGSRRDGVSCKNPPSKLRTALLKRPASTCARLRIVNRQVHGAERKLDELCTAVSEIEQTSGEGLQRRDVAILRSMPGIGRINLGTLLSEASGPLSRRDYEGLRTLSGAAPVTKRSGKSLIVVRRYAAHVRLRDTVYHWARVATQRDPRCRARYTAVRKRGHSHGRALRGVADRLLALACVLLQRQTLFDP